MPITIIHYTMVIITSQYVLMVMTGRSPGAILVVEDGPAW
jgi:hypothetical protein